MIKNTMKKVTGLAAIEGHLLRRRYFDQEVLAHVAERIKQGEQGHTGELVLAVEAVMPSHESEPHLRALEVYGRLRVWDTPLNSGVLLYIALDKQAIEIIADRGITATNGQWQGICEPLQQRFAQADYIDALMDAVDAIQVLLKEHAPAGDTEVNVLPDEPVVL